MGFNSVFKGLMYAVRSTGVGKSLMNGEYGTAVCVKSDACKNVI